MRYGLLRVTTPDGHQRDYPLSSPSVTLGNSPENIVVISHATVAPRHARLTIDSGMPVIEDLGSESGVYVGNRRLAPGERVLVGAEPIRLGGVQVTYHSPDDATNGRPVTGGLAAAPAATAAGPGAVSRLVVEVKEPPAPVDAGGVTAAVVEVHNRGATVEEVTFALEGDAAAWAEAPVSVVALLPGAREQVHINLQPPRASDTHAGSHPLTVVVRQRSSGQEHRATTTVTVRPFQGLSLAIAPVRSQRNFRVTLENTGNAPAAASLRGEDDEGAMVFDFPSLDVSVPPGGREVVPLRVKLPGAPRFGREQVKPFRVEATLASGDGDALRAAGQLRVKPSLEPFKLPVIILAVVAALAIGGITYAARCESWGLPGCRGDSSPVVAGGETPLAQDTQTPGETVVAPTAGGSTMLTTTPVGGGTGAGETPDAATPTATPPLETPTPPPTEEPTTTPTPSSPQFDAPALVLDPEKSYIAIVTTNKGEFTIGLDVGGAFETSNSFAFLAMKGFYDGMPFTITAWAAEHGDPGPPLPGTAGYTLEAQYTQVQDVRGTVGMVPLEQTGSPNEPVEVGSHWYINLSDNFHFDTGGFAGVPRPVFGAVRSGIEVVEELEDGDIVESIEIEEFVFRPFFPRLTPIPISTPTIGP